MPYDGQFGMLFLIREKESDDVKYDELEKNGDVD